MKKKLPEKLEWSRVRTGYYASDDSYGANGMFEIIGPTGRILGVIASDGKETMWEHVSVSLPNRAPNWDEMCWVKDMFWEPEECVIQYHPPKSDYVNVHPYCLHLWRPIKETIPRPDSIMVGV